MENELYKLTIELLKNEKRYVSNDLLRQVIDMIASGDLDGARARMDKKFDEADITNMREQMQDLKENYNRSTLNTHLTGMSKDLWSTFMHPIDEAVVLLLCVVLRGFDPMEYIQFWQNDKNKYADMIISEFEQGLSQ